MAIAFVRNSGTVHAEVSAENKITVKITAGAVGNHWVVAAAIALSGLGSTITEITDSAGDVFSLDDSHENAGVRIQVWSGQIKSAATTELTITFEGSAKGHLASVGVYEFSGIKGTSWAHTVAQEASAGTAVTAGPTSLALSTTDLWVAAFATTAATGSFTFGGTATQLTGVAGGAPTLGAEYELTPKAEKATATGSFSVTGTWTGVIVAYTAGLVGTTAAVSGFKAGLKPRIGGKTTGTSHVTGGMVPNLGGKTASTAHVIAGLVPNLAGAVVATSHVTGGMVPNLGGKTAGTSALTATLKTHLKLSGSTTSTAAFTAGLEPRLAGKVAGKSGFTATMHSHLKLAGTTVSTAHVTGGMMPRLAGKVTSTAAFTLTMNLKLEGTAVEENEVTDPSFEYGAAGWIAEKNVVVRTEEQAFSGTHSLRGERTSATEGTLVFYKNTPGTLGKPATYWDGAVSEGYPYTFSVYIRAATVGRKATCRIDWYNAAREKILTGASTEIKDSPTEWIRCTRTEVAPPGAVAALLRVNIIGVALGEQHYIDALQRTQTATAQPYGDGDYAGWFWTGPAGESVSETHARNPIAIAGTSGFTAGMVPRLAGTVSSTSAFTAALSVHQHLSGTTASTSAFTAGLEPRLRGSVTSTSTFTASLITRGQLAGSTASTSHLTAGLEPKLAGSTASTSAFTAALSVHELLTGSIVGAAQFTAGMVPRLAGSISSTATFTGALTEHPVFTGSTEGVAHFTGTMSGPLPLTGSTTGVAHFTAGLVPRLAGTTTSIAAFIGHLSTHEKLIGYTLSVANFAGGLRPRLAGTCTSNATFTFFGVLTIITLAGEEEREERRTVEEERETPESGRTEAAAAGAPTVGHAMNRQI